jgi:beta-phosphoglucomutase
MSAVIFDVDGTLVDLFELHYQGFLSIIRQEVGLEFERQDLREHYGKTGEEIFEAFFLKHGITGVDVGQIAPKRRRWVIEHLDYCRVLEGVRSLLEELREAKIPMAVGTSNTPDIGNAILKACGLYAFFNYMAFRSPAIRSKPAPDIFLAAASGLGINANECLVFEDSTFGIAAAKAAGMRVVAVATGTHSKKELIAQRPDLLVDSLREVSLQDVRHILGKVEPVVP